MYPMQITRRTVLLDAQSRIFNHQNQQRSEVEMIYLPESSTTSIKAASWAHRAYEQTGRLLICVRQARARCTREVADDMQGRGFQSSLAKPLF